uniref:G protein-coupled receptor n=1 Tax=Panagrellus redivivus TaxID=6233 RepID=A0A7E4VYL1_PANRE
MYRASQVVSSVCEGFFFTSLCSNLALAVNRLDIFKPSWIPSKVYMTRGHAYIIFTIGGVLGAAFITIAFSPLLVVFFDHERMTLRFDGPLRDFMPGLLFWTTTVLVTVILGCYLLIFASIVIKRKKHTNNNRAKIAASEVKLLISAAIQFFTIFISVLSLYFQQLLPPIVVFINTLFLSGMQPIVHVVVNRKLRRRYLKGIHVPSSTHPIHNNPLAFMSTR